MNLQKLFKYAKSGAVQEWSIRVGKKLDGAAFYTVAYGQTGGAIQETHTFITSGKNIGKSNETTPLEQATLEARAKWRLQLDKGYAAGKPKSMALDSPMLAKSYDKEAAKVTFPCYYQPKLDGVRCIASRIGDDIMLVSRKGKEFKTLEHIKKVLLNVMNDGDIFDGELYIHGTTFQKVISWVKRLQPDTKKVMYNVYDMIDSGTFRQRFDKLLSSVGPNGVGIVQTVFTSQVNSHAGIKKTLEKEESLGFEGIMLRNGSCLYQRGRRSSDLLKVKSFHENEYIIVGAEENKGRQKGQCTFVCKMPDGTQFKCKPMGTDAERKEMWTNHKSYIGKELTVRYFELTTSDNPVPRFPIGIVRDYE